MFRHSSLPSSGWPDGIGTPRPRIEDRKLLTGQGAYVGDFHPDNLSYAVVVRSPYAHAHIRRIEVDAARSMAGVLAVLTGADARADGLRAIPHNPDWRGPPDAELRLPVGSEVFLTDHEVLPAEVVRFVGEPLVLVVAATHAEAVDAAERVEIDFEPLAAAVHCQEALAADAPQLWPGCPDNTALICEVGDESSVREAFAHAAHIVDLETWVQRVNGAPMEPRAAIGEYDSNASRYILRAASGRGAVQTRERLAITLGVPIERCRAVFGDMGGNFGTRNAFFPEYTLVAWAAKRVGRPVKWTATRSECFLSDYQARDLTSRAELALDSEGNFLALRGENTLNLGAYTVYFWPLRKGLSMMQGGYDIPAVYFKGRAVLTNTAPTAVYRSAGRPEAIFVIERLIDRAAAQCGFDRVELRRRNLIGSEAMPYTNAVGVTYDSGDYGAAMVEALSASDWNGFEARRDRSAARGLCRGIAVANYIEVTSGIPRERAELVVHPEGVVDLVVGTMSSGQGHETTFPQLACEWLQLPFDRIRFVANDTDRVSVGGGSHSGRSMRLISIALGEAVRALLDKGKAIASHVLQAPVAEVDFVDGLFRTHDGASMGFFEVAQAAAIAGTLPDELCGQWLAVGDVTNRAGGYPYGAHVCEVEVDPETGEVQVVAWTGVDDVGLAVNPLVLHGQAQGAVAQGIGQALCEAVYYESGSAQLLSGSFMDYALPRADTLPPIETVVTEVPATSHPYGIRPGGEGGTTPAPAALVNAVVDALHEYDVSHIEMPLTPERVLQAIRGNAVS